MRIPVALQLYTVRDETSRDFIKTLEKVAAMGYEGVEFAGFGNISANDMKTALDRIGLKVAGSHMGIDLLEKKLDEVIEYNLEIGNKYIICPWAPFKTKEDYLEAGRKFNDIGAKCNARGIKFAYHNHDFEFAVFDGEYGLDIMFSQASPENLLVELDTCWVFYAGVNPVEYMKKYKGRCPLIHLKDIKSRKRDDNIELGEGIADVAGIATAAKTNGTKWYIVEMDSCPRPSLESSKICIDNLKKMGII